MTAIGSAEIIFRSCAGSGSAPTAGSCDSRIRTCSPVAATLFGSMAAPAATPIQVAASWVRATCPSERAFFSRFCVGFSVLSVSPAMPQPPAIWTMVVPAWSITRFSTPGTW